MRKLTAALLVAVALGASGLAQADEQPSTTLSGVMFLDLTDLTTQTNGKDVDPTGYGLDVKRFYIGVTHVFDDTWSANFTTDFNYSATTGETQLFAKKAYLQQRAADWATLRYGAADMPWVPYVEGFYGYRFVEKTLEDRLGFANTVDWGVNFFGQAGAFTYAASVVNGGGYKNPSRSKGMDEELRGSFTPVDGLTFALGYYNGKLGQDTEATPAQHTASRENLLVVWKARGLTLGGEYFSADNFTKAAVTTAVADKADGYSLFGSYDFPDTAWSVFARYDEAKPDKDVTPSKQDKYYNAGVAWKTSGNITWAAALKHETLDSTGTDTKSDEIGVWALVKF